MIKQHQQSTYITNIVYFLCTFCFFQILPIDAEVQPFAVFIAAIFLARRLPDIDLKVYAALIFYVLFFVIGMFQFQQGTIELNALMASASALIIGPIIGLFFIFNGPPSEKLNFGIIVFLSTFAAAQSFFPSLLVATGIESLLTLFIPRFSSAMLSDWDRGITLLAPEPANMAPILVMTFCTFLSHYSTFKIDKFRVAIYITSISFLFFTNKSITLFLCLIVFSTFFAIFSKKRIITSSLAFLLILVVIQGPISFIPESRLTLAQGSLADLTFGNLQQLDAQFGSRFSILIVSFRGLLEFGNGFGSWSNDFVELARFASFDVFSGGYFYLIGGTQNIKPSSILAIAAIDMGFFAIPFFALLITAYFPSKGVKPSLAPAVWASWACGISLVAIGGTPVTLPAFWVMIGIAIADLRRRNLMKFNSA